MAQAKDKKPYVSQYAQEVADTFVDLMEKNQMPWQKPWKPPTGPGEHALSYNPITGTRYSGINQMALQFKQAKNNWEDNRWLTYKQAAAIGAQVRKGEKGTRIERWIFEEKRDATDEQGRPIKETVKLERPKVVTFHVFNAEQIDDMPPPRPRTDYEKPWEPHARAQAILDNCGVSIKHDGGDRAYYSITSDSIHMPERGQFADGNKYYSTASHEMCHSTGHESRFNRPFGRFFGTPDYAQEELVAEISSYMIGKEIGIGYDEIRNSAYVKNWVQQVKEDPNALISACRDAEKVFKVALDMENGLEIQWAERRGVVATKEAERQQAEQEKGTVADMSEEAPRNYRAVAYVDRFQASKAGLKYDATPGVKSWYAPEGLDPERYKDFPQKTHRAITERQQPNLEAVREDFRQACDAKGLIMQGDHPIMDGKLHRVPVAGDKGRSTSGAYVGHLNEWPAGYIQNFKDGLGKDNWKAGKPLEFVSEADREAFTKQVEAKKEARVQEQDKIHEAAANKSMSLWKWGNPAQADHPYLVNKGIQSIAANSNVVRELPPRDGDKYGTLVVPLYDITGKMTSIQMIQPNGDKSYKSGGVKEGSFVIIGSEENGDKPAAEILKKTPRIVEAEGLATGQTLSLAMQQPVVIVFDCNNFSNVTTALIENGCKDKTYAILGDNDHHTNSANPNQENAGKIQAELAAKAAVELGVKAIARVPELTQEQKELGLTDYNDIAMAGHLTVEDGISWSKQFGKEIAAIEKEVDKSEMAAEKEIARVVKQARSAKGKGKQAEELGA